MCSSTVHRLEGERPHSSQAALWASAALELWSCSNAKYPKAGPGRHAGSFWGMLIVQDLYLVKRVLGCCYCPPCKGGDVWDCGGCSCCQQGHFITAEARGEFRHCQIHKAMSNHVGAF